MRLRAWARVGARQNMESAPKLRSAPVFSDSQEQRQNAEHPMNFCPVCSQRLESKRCKLICNTCGYYLSCSDFY
jgi:hypothetical protein